MKTSGDDLLLEFASVVDAVRCVSEIQAAIAAHNADIPAERRIECRADILTVKETDSKAALAVQTRLREEFQDALRDGYIVTGFERGDKDCAYLLEKNQGPTL